MSMSNESPIGERRNRPVAELEPAPSSGPDLDRLIAEGRVSRPVRSGLPEPLELTGDPRALSRALDDVRGRAEV